MTKYILNSGGLRNNPPLARKFLAEVVKGLGNKPRLLICFFAQPREYWEEKFAQDKEEIPKLLPKGVSPILELAFPQTFEKQMKNSDAIYIHGGDDHLIRYWLKQFKIPKIWEGKVVATNSASSDALAKYFWTCDWRQCMNGLGILPIKFIAHYNSSYGKDNTEGPIDWNNAHDELKSFGDPKIPIHALEEGNYIIINT